MAKEQSGTRGPKKGPASLDMRRRVLDAAIDALKEDGFAGTSIRSIARRGEFNSALIFYYFGSLNELLLAALDHTSELRMEAYRTAVEGIDTLEGLIAVAIDVYREDLAAGHITVFSELVGASLSQPELRSEIVTRAEPWVEFVEKTIRRVTAGTPLEAMLPVRDIAYGTIAFYLGVNLLTHLDADRKQIESLFQTAAAFTPMMSPLLEGFRG